MYKRIFNILYVIVFPFYTIYYFIKEHSEIAFILLNLMILGGSLSMQFQLLPVPQWLIIKSVEPTDFYSVLFQSQVTISTLSITVVALLTGLSATKYYGITITSYVFKLKPKLLTHTVLIFFSFFFIVINSLALANGWYNLVTAILLCSILFCARMAFDIIAALLKGSDIRTDIWRYVSGRCLRARSLHEVLNLFHMLSSDIEESVKTNNMVTLFADTDLLFKQVAYEVFSVDWSAPIFSTNEYSYSDIADLCKKAIDPLLSSEQVPVITHYYKTMQLIYEMFTYRKISIDIWEKVASRVFTIMAIIDPSSLLGSGCVRELRLALYENIGQQSDTWEGITHFLPDLHHALKGNKYYTEISEQMKIQYWREFVYNDTVDRYSYHDMTDSIDVVEKPRSQELIFLLCDAIDTSDHLLLSEMYPIRSVRYKVVNLAMMAYIYCQISRSRISKSELGFYAELLDTHNLDYDSSLSLNTLIFNAADCTEVCQYFTDIYGKKYNEHALLQDLLMEFCLLYQLSHYNADSDKRFANDWDLFIANEVQRRRLKNIPYLLKSMHLNKKLHNFLILMRFSQDEDDYHAALSFYQKYCEH